VCRQAKPAHQKGELKASTRKSKMGLVKKRKLRAGEWKGSKRRLLAKLARTPAHQVQEFKADAASD